MAQSGILIYEKRPRWVPELQRQLQQQDVRIRNCPTIRDLTTNLANHARTVVILDLTAGAGECLQFLRSTPDSESTRLIVVIASQQTLDLEWPMRELGADAFLLEPIAGNQLAKLCRAQLSQ